MTVDDDLDLEAMDSGDAAFAGMLVGGAIAYALTDGNWAGVALGAGAGLAVSGESFDRILGAADAADDE